MSSKTYETVYFTPSHCCHRGLSHHHPLPKLLQLWTGLLAFYPCPLSPNPRYSQHISKRFFFLIMYVWKCHVSTQSSQMAPHFTSINRALIISTDRAQSGSLACLTSFLVLPFLFTYSQALWSGTSSSAPDMLPPRDLHIARCPRLNGFPVDVCLAHS